MQIKDESLSVISSTGIFFFFYFNLDSIPKLSKIYKGFQRDVLQTKMLDVGWEAGHFQNLG